MKQKKKSKSTNSKMQQNYNQVGSSNQPKALPSKSKSYGAKEQQFRDQENRVGHNSNENTWDFSRRSSVSDMWSDTDEHFPTLGASAVHGPKVNVWEERKSKQEAVKKLEPQNEYDEEAMLQRALALSLLEATEEEKRRKKMEEDYRMQLETLQCFPEDLEYFDASDNIIVKENSKLQDFPIKEQHQLENCSKNSVSNSSENETTYNSRGSELQNDFPVMEHHWNTESCSGNSISNYSQKENQSYNSGGARPKINKAIEAFGGWGIKGDKKRKNSEKVSEFIDDVIFEKPFEKSDNYSKASNGEKNKCKSTKENCNSSKENTWHSADTKNVRKSSTTLKSGGKDEILYDEKGAFLDDDDGNWSDSKSETVNLQSVSPNKVLDMWLSSEDADDSNNENEVPVLNDKRTNNFIPAPSFNEMSKIEDDKDKNSSVPIEFSTPTVASNYEPKDVEDSQTLFKKVPESSKNIWSNSDNYKEQDLSENKNVYNYDACDLNVNNFTPFHEPTQVPTLASSTIWSDKSPNDSSYFNSFSDNLSSKLESVKLDQDIDNEIFSVASSSNGPDVPPIPAPQPPATVAAVHDYNAAVIPNSDCNVEPPIIPQLQPVPEMLVPQFPILGNPILNPMFPGLNPMLGCGMDPLLMRQMLILSNPFLANQLLAMEQYYRSLGVPVDLFSMTSPMPNMSGLMNPSLLQSTFANSVNGDMEQLQTQIDVNASVSKSAVESLEQKSCEKSDAISDFNNSSASVENCNDDPWFKSYLSNDNASIIPPPKPPSSEINCSNLMPVPQKSESSQIASSYDNNFAHSHAFDNSTVHSSNTNKKGPLTAFDTCVTKKEATGWNDPEDDFLDARNLKTQTWDDGWGDAIAPPKPIRNPSLHEDRKKVVLRQPAKQPQISRYQKNFTYS